MQVNFSFDSEKEDVGELKKLYSWLGELITKREGTKACAPQPVQLQQSVPITSKLNPNEGFGGGWPTRYSEPNINKPMQQQSVPEEKEKKKPSRTAGGCRVVEYDSKVEDMVFNLFGRKH